LEDFFEQYLARLRDEPELGEGKQEQDPEMTLFHDLGKLSQTVFDLIILIFRR